MALILSLSVAAVTSAAASAQTMVVSGTHVRTIHTSLYGPPSPDPAGITYVAATDRFLISDSEVDELNAYAGANLFTATRSGSGSAMGTTLGFSQEPTGLGYDPATATLFISDDDRRRVFLDRPGLDGIHGTGDDSVTNVSTGAFGSTDPEGVEYDPRSGHLFVADGLGVEVYDINPGNGVFGDGDDTVTHFDVARYGSRDAEGIGIDPQRNLLLVIDPLTKSLYELTRAGALFRIINLRGIPTTHRRYAGVTMAPTSSPNDSPSRRNYWIVDRQIDNAFDANENDGKLYEVFAPAASPGARILVGSVGDDVLVGTAANNVIYGRGGDDVIYGRGGGDIIVGGAGDDRVVGGSGRDRLAGGPGHDTLLGGTRSDRLRGGRGRDRMFGNRGADFIVARDGQRDTVDGGRGRDEGRVDRGLDRVRSLERRRAA